MTEPIIVPFKGDEADLIVSAKKVQAEMDALDTRLKKAGVSQSAYNKAVADAKAKQDQFTKSTAAGKVSITDFKSALDLTRQAVQTLKQGFDFAKEGAQIEFTRGKFDRLAESIGTTSDALLSDLQVATKGTLSDMEIMASATDLVALGLANSHDEAVRLAKVSAGLNMNMNQLVLTLTNMTTMRFDALGVRVDGFKEKVAELEKQGYSTDAAFKEAFLQQAEEQLITVGNAADTSLGSFMRLEAGFKNLTDASKTMAATALNPIVDKLNETNDAINDTRTDVEIYNRVMAESGGQLVLSRAQHNMLRDEITRVAQEYRDAEEAIKEQGEALSENLPVLEMTEEQIKELTKANQKELDTLGDMTNTLKKYSDETADLAKKHEELTAEKNKLIAQGYWPESEAIQDVNKKLDENVAKQQENAAEFEMATNRRILARAEEMLSIDGLTTEEKEGLIERGLAMGVYTEEAARKMKEEESAAYNLAAALRSIPTQVTTTIITYRSDVQLMQGSGGAGTVRGPRNIPHASGGDFLIPMSYGNEGFRMGNGDTASGGERVTITPRGEQPGNAFDYRAMGREMTRAFKRAMAEMG